MGGVGAKVDEAVVGQLHHRVELVAVLQLGAEVRVDAGEDAEIGGTLGGLVDRGRHLAQSWQIGLAVTGTARAKDDAIDTHGGQELRHFRVVGDDLLGLSGVAETATAVEGGQPETTAGQQIAELVDAILVGKREVGKRLAGVETEL